MGMDIYFTEGVFLTFEQISKLITSENRERFTEIFKIEQPFSEPDDVYHYADSFDETVDKFNKFFSEFHPDLPPLKALGEIYGHDVCRVEVVGDYPYEEIYFLFSTEDCLVETPTEKGKALAAKTGAVMTKVVAPSVSV